MTVLEQYADDLSHAAERLVTRETGRRRRGRIAELAVGGVLVLGGGAAAATAL